MFPALGISLYFKEVIYFENCCIIQNFYVCTVGLLATSAQVTWGQSQSIAFFRWKFEHTYPLIESIGDALPVQEELSLLVIPLPT